MSEQAELTEAELRGFAEAHGVHAVNGDIDALAADIIPSQRYKLGDVAALLPNPVVTAPVVQAGELDGNLGVVVVEYAGADGSSQKIRSIWERRSPMPQIIDYRPVD